MVKQTVGSSRVRNNWILWIGVSLLMIMILIVLGLYLRVNRGSEGGGNYSSGFVDLNGEQLPTNFVSASDNGMTVVMFGRIEDVFRRDDFIKARVTFFNHAGENRRFVVVLGKDNIDLPLSLIIQRVPDLFPNSDVFDARTLRGNEIIDQLNNFEGRVGRLTLLLNLPPNLGSSDQPLVDFLSEYLDCNRTLYKWISSGAELNCEPLITQVAIYEQN